MSGHLFQVVPIKDQCLPLISSITMFGVLVMCRLLWDTNIVTFIDDFSRCTWITLLKDRSELFGVFQMFCSEIKTQFGKTF